MPATVQSQTASETEAPTGFDNLTNGMTTQATFDDDRAVFEEHETIEDGLGPLYNADSCAACHATPVTGGSSQISDCVPGSSMGSCSLTTQEARSLMTVPFMRIFRSMCWTTIKSGRSAWPPVPLA